MRQKILCILTAAMLLTGCAGGETAPTYDAPDTETDIAVITDDTAPSETDTAPAETSGTDTTETTADTAAGNTAPPAASLSDDETELAAAAAVLNRYFEGIRDNDTEKVIEAANLRALMKALHNEELNEEEFAEGFSDETLRGLTWELGTGEMRADLTEEYNKSLAETLADFDEDYEDADEEDRAMMDAMREIMKPAEAICEFEVSVTVDGDTDEDDLMLIRTDGKWHLDTMLINSMLGYVKKSRSSAANASAKTVYNAAICAVTDLDAEDLFKSELFSGEISYTPEDFANAENVKAPGTADEMKTTVAYRMKQYFSDVEQLESIVLSVENGNVSAVAVGYVSGSKTVYGTYPVLTDKDALADADSVEEALALAKAAWEDNR